MRTITFDELPELIGQELAVGDWVLIDQARIDRFAEATGDHQWIHVDAARAAAGPYGRTIAHGFLTLSLLPLLLRSAFTIESSLTINYGLNGVRFPSPVPVDSRVRGRFALKGLQALPPIEGRDGYQVTMTMTIELDGSTKPACVAESVTRRYR
ncbi:MAG: MaoC family dehydratase [Lautropia sp.]